MRFYRAGASEEEVEAELRSISCGDNRPPARWSEAFAFPKPLVIGCGVRTACVLGKHHFAVFGADRCDSWHRFGRRFICEQVFEEQWN